MTDTHGIGGRTVKAINVDRVELTKLTEIVKGHSAGTIQPSRLRVGTALLRELPRLFPPPQTRDRWDNPASTMERLFAGIPIIHGPLLPLWQWVHETHDGHELARGDIRSKTSIFRSFDYPDWRDAVGGDFI